jgi:hypothetical protein
MDRRAYHFHDLQKAPLRSLSLAVLLFVCVVVVVVVVVVIGFVLIQHGLLSIILHRFKPYSS